MIAANQSLNLSGHYWIKKCKLNNHRNSVKKRVREIPFEKKNEKFWGNARSPLSVKGVEKEKFFPPSTSTDLTQGQSPLAWLHGAIKSQPFCNNFISSTSLLVQYSVHSSMFGADHLPLESSFLLPQQRFQFLFGALDRPYMYLVWPVKKRHWVFIVGSINWRPFTSQRGRLVICVIRVVQYWWSWLLGL